MEMKPKYDLLYFLHFILFFHKSKNFLFTAPLLSITNLDNIHALSSLISSNYLSPYPFLNQNYLFFSFFPKSRPFRDLKYFVCILLLYN
jgi:hypothetical protein